MYSLNGIPLNEGHGGWRILRENTNTQGGLTNTLNQVKNPNRPGYVPAPSVYTEQTIILNVRTPKTRLEELLALCAAATTLSRTDDNTKEASIEIASALPSPSDTPLDAVHDVTITIVVPEGVWRDVNAVVDGPTSITSPTTSLTMLGDLSAPVYDANIFLRGVFGEFTLTDSGGSQLKTTRAWSGTASTGLLYVGATQQAFLANESNPWVPVSDASSYISVSGNGGFRLVPKLVGGDPDNRRVELSLTTLTQTSTTLRVQAKRAYRMN